MATLGMGFTLVAIFFFFVAYKLYKPPVPRKKESEAEREEEPMNAVENTGANCGSELTEDTNL